MTRKRFDKSELNWIDSDYLCLFCYEPIYYHLKTRKEMCANKNCKMYNFSPKIIEYTDNSPGVIEFRKKFQKSLEKFSNFNKNTVYNRLNELRAKACNDFFLFNGLKLDHLIGINFLLVKCTDVTSWGTDTDVKNCDIIIQDCLQKYSDLKFVEELELKNYVIDSDNTPYRMKYFDEIEQVRKVLGIVNQAKYGPEDVNSFYFIDVQSKTGKPKGPYDFETIYKNHFGLVITFNHIFKYGYFISKIHRFPSKTSDLAMFFSLWTQCIPGKINSVNKEDLKIIYDGVMKVNHITGNFEEFLTDYSSGQEFAPVIIYDEQYYNFDYASLFFFMLYIFSLNKNIEGGQTLSGFQTLNDQRKISAKTFENVIRDKFRNDGYKVYPDNNQEFRIKIDGYEHEYDCIAIDENSKIIILVDAKYEDIAPSSTSGGTIVEQSILDTHDGLLIHSRDQHKRRRFFTKNCKQFPFGIEKFWEYQIISIVITKHTPLIKKHLTTNFMSYEKFKSYDFHKWD